MRTLAKSLPFLLILSSLVSRGDDNPDNVKGATYGVEISGVTQWGLILSHRIFLLEKQNGQWDEKDNGIEGDYLIGGIIATGTDVGRTVPVELFYIGVYDIGGKIFTCLTGNKSDYLNFKKLEENNELNEALGIVTSKFRNDPSLKPAQ